ncbi:MAG: MFS transporter [Proteobacteria bacterium]|nr:MFS transporter [Pseudomonadota bacterium]
MAFAQDDRPLPAGVIGGLVTLVAILSGVYMVGQLLRNSVGVIAPDLAQELALSASQIGILSSAFFFAFAAVQLPLGIALDRYGPKRCMLTCSVAVVAGALLFAAATSPAALVGARILMGLGTSCYLMAPLALFARQFSANRFAMLAGLQLGFGSIGTLLATAPLAFSAAAIGWRATFVGIAVVMLAAAVLIAIIVRDDPARDVHARDEHSHAEIAGRESLRDGLRGLVEVLRTDSVGRLFFVHVTTYAGYILIVGLWGGPYLTHVYGYGLTERGNFLLIPAITQAAGMIVWGMADRLFGGYKIPVLIGAGLTISSLVVIAAGGKLPPLALCIVLALFGFFAAYSAQVIAHGKALFPKHLVGRGLTVLNMGSMGGVFFSQAVSGVVIDLFPTAGGANPLAAFQTVFLLQAAFILASCIVYLRAREP